MKNLLLFTFLILSVFKLQAQSCCDLGKKVGFADMIQVWHDPIISSETGEEISNHLFFFFHKPDDDLCIPSTYYKENYVKKIHPAFAQAVKNSLIYKKLKNPSQNDFDQPSMDGLRGLNQYNELKKSADYSIHIEMDFNVKPYISNLEKCSVLINKSSNSNSAQQKSTNYTNSNSSSNNSNYSNNSSRNTGLDPDLERKRQRVNDIQKFINQQNIKIQQQQQFGDGLSNAVGNAIGANGKVDALSVIKSLPTAQTNQQAYTNLAVAGVATIGQLIQQRNQRKAREEAIREQWRREERAITEFKYEKVKNGVGQFDELGRKTGFWSYYNKDMKFTQQGHYYKGKKIGGWITYKFNEWSTNDKRGLLDREYEGIYGYSFDFDVSFLTKHNAPQSRYFKKDRMFYQDHYSHKNTNGDFTVKYDDKDLGYHTLTAHNMSLLTTKSIYDITTNRWWPIGFFQLRNQNNIIIQEGGYDTSGRKQGVWETYSPTKDLDSYQITASPLANGFGTRQKLANLATYKNGKRHGYYRKTLEKGYSSDPYIEGYYYNGRKIGTWYKLMPQKGDSEHKIPDDIIAIYEFGDGIEKGEFSTLDLKGNILSKGFTEKGEIIGTETFYNGQGDTYKSVEHKSKRKFIDYTKTAIDVKGDYKEGLARVRLNGKWGYINKELQLVIPFIYETALDFSNELAVVVKEGQRMFINKQGNIVIQSNEFERLGNFIQPNIATARINGKWGAINRKGEKVIPFDYEFPLYFHDHLALNKVNGKDVYINKNGNVAFESSYDRTWPFKEGRAKVEKDGKYGFINLRNELVISCVYFAAKDFNENVASVKYSKNKWGYINKNGMFILKGYYFLSNLEKGVAIASNGSRLFGIDVDRKKKAPNVLRHNPNDLFAYIKDSEYPEPKVVSKEENQLQYDRYIKANSKKINSDKFSTIHIYRPKALKGSGVKFVVKINGKTKCHLKNGGYLEYKVHNQGEFGIEVYIEQFGKKRLQSNILIDVIDEKDYYLKVSASNKKSLEQISQSIDQDKLKKDKFISLSD